MTAPDLGIIRILKISNQPPIIVAALNRPNKHGDGYPGIATKHMQSVMRIKSLAIMLKKKAAVR